MKAVGATLRGVIFDVDGTLAETEELHRRAFNETFAAHGVNWDWDQALYRVLLGVTGGKERMAAYMRDHLGETVDAEWIARVHKDKTERYNALVNEGALTLRPGIAELVADARDKGVRLGVATTTSRPNIESLCSACFKAALDDIFDAVAAGDEVPEKKPAPDVYELALSRLGLEAEDCVALEDSCNGLLSAKAAGLRCIVSPSVYISDDDFPGADALVESFAEAPSLAGLEGLLRKGAA